MFIKTGIHRLGNFRENEHVDATIEKNGEYYHVIGRYTGERSVRIVRDSSLPDDHEKLYDELEEILNKKVKAEQLKTIVN
ncbi:MULTISPECIES: hypothetical protein [Bacillus cereus group]|uniref:hypothetical protein n=1 Tax=Bacillus cereus group TaxID=86661 RepID=UPI0008FE1CDB|nr:MULTISPECIES: hypothetical protein [Bacillus cereus group]MDG1621888.1 hypothetical protein [Bacillus mobilis]MDX5838020.1 hypothetical protein [Bacillus cereus group sp. BfR-BA-01700]OJE35751.1 hypothetical protein BAQ44_17955 [Bacillus mobilis]HDR7243851.1 hypothetical protein [Bacillus mobilis]